MMNYYYVLCICIKLFFESWTKKSFTCSYCNCNSMAVNDVFQIAPFFSVDKLLEGDIVSCCFIRTHLHKKILYKKNSKKNYEMIFLLLCHQVHHIAYFLDYSPNLYYCTLPGSSIFLINLFTKKVYLRRQMLKPKSYTYLW